MSRLEELRKENAVYSAAAAFYRKHREIWACDGNTALISSAVEAAEQPQTLESWEKIAPSVRLATRPIEVEEPAEPQTPALVAPFGLEKLGIKTFEEARRRIDGATWKSYMFDKDPRTGKPSTKSLAFRQWIEDLQKVGQ